MSTETLNEKIESAITDAYSELQERLNLDYELYHAFCESIKNGFPLKELERDFQMEEYRQLYLKALLSALNIILEDFSDKKEIINLDKSSESVDYELDLKSYKPPFYSLHCSNDSHIKTADLLNSKKCEKIIINGITLTIFKPIERKPSAERIKSLKEELEKTRDKANIINPSIFTYSGINHTFRFETDPIREANKKILNNNANDLEKELSKLQAWSNISDQDLINWKTLYKELLNKLGLSEEGFTPNNWKVDSRDYHQKYLPIIDEKRVKVLIKADNIRL